MGDSRLLNEFDTKVMRAKLIRDGKSDPGRFSDKYTVRLYGADLWRSKRTTNVLYET